MQTQGLPLILALTPTLILIATLALALGLIPIWTSTRAKTPTQRAQARVPLHLTQTHFSIGPVTTCSLTTLIAILGSTCTACHPVLPGPPVRA